MRNFKAMPHKQMGFWGQVIGAVVGAYASKRAADKQVNATREGLDKQIALSQPYVDAGKAGLNSLQSFVDTGANFADTQAFKDIVNTQKAGGGYLSGNTLTGLTDYYATNFRPQRLNELGFLPQMGQAAAAGQAANIGTAYDTIGQSKAGGILGIGNAINGGISQYQFLNYLKSKGGG